MQPINPFRARLAALLLGFTCLGLLNACEPIAIIADTLVGDVRKAQFKPAPKLRSLVLVDDPERLFDAPLYRNLISTYFVSNMKQKEAVLNFVPLTDLQIYAESKGEDFAQIPMDQIGRDLGAEQVFYIRIRNLRVDYGPGVYRPMCLMDVRLINATDGQRIWPPKSEGYIAAGPQPGFELFTSLNHKVDNVGMAGSSRAMTEALARQCGVDASRLFYDWHVSMDATDDEKPE